SLASKAEGAMVQIWSGVTPSNPVRRSLVWRVVLRCRRRAELVELCARRFAYQPQRFRWHGLLHTVRTIERVWERGGSRKRSPRRYFSVTCHNDQRYTLFQDLQLGAWYVEV